MKVFLKVIVMVSTSCKTSKKCYTLLQLMLYAMGYNLNMNRTIETEKKKFFMLYYRPALFESGSNLSASAPATVTVVVYIKIKKSTISHGRNMIKPACS